MTATTLILFAAGLILLMAGAESLVRGAARLAAALGAPPLAIGLTVVAFGTSSPEALVGVQASLAGQSDIALGNVVGSNIFNVLLILGLSAAVAPLVVSQQLVRLDVPIMIGVSGLVMMMAMNGSIGRVEGLLLLAGILTYTTLMARAMGRSRARMNEVEPDRAARHPLDWLKDLALIAGGLGVMVLGSRWLVNGAVELARWFGVNELVIGLTIVAAGTSLPEVATSVTASLRGERDIAVGNIVGSNIFNLMFVLGTAAVVSPVGVHVPTAALTFDMPVMLAVAIACLPIFVTGYRVGRREGAIFLIYYVAYITFLVLDATAHDVLPIFTSAMTLFVLPLTIITLVLVAIQTKRRVTPRE